MSYKAAFISSPSDTILESADPLGGQIPINRNSVSMQNSTEYVMPQGSSLAGSAQNSKKRNRKLKDFQDYETFPLVGNHQTRALQPPPQVVGQDSLLDFNPTIDAIKAKHGDIDKDCILKSPEVRKANLLVICNLLKELQKKRADELDHTSLESYYETSRDIQKLNIHIEWLLERLDQIKDAIKSRDQANVLIQERDECMKKVEEKMEKVKRHKSEIENLENQIARENKMIERLNEFISTRTSKFQQFKDRPLTYGLI